MPALDADAIFWFGSTIAQCVVALLAFAAFLAAWRLDALTKAGWSEIELLWRDIRTVLGHRLADKARPEGKTEAQWQAMCAKGKQTVPEFLRGNRTTVPERVHVERKGLWHSHRNWITTHRLGAAIVKHRVALDSRMPITNGVFTNIKRRTEQIKPTVQLIRSLRLWLGVLTISGLAALVLGLVVVAVAYPLVASPVLGTWVLGALAVATAGAVGSAGMLGRAIFRQPESWR